MIPPSGHAGNPADSESDPVCYAGRRFFRIALLGLFVTVWLGALLRWQAINPTPGLVYGNLLHAHSHMGFLAWVFNAFFALAWARFVQETGRRRSIQLFITLQFANLGMLLSFPFQGYGPVSIAFTTLHSVAAVWFAILLWRSDRVHPRARPWLRSSLLCMFASSLGPVVLGPLAALDLRETPLYANSIYWYLHFQYNGWFILFPLALLAQTVAQRETALRKALETGFLPVLAGVVLTFGVSLFWNPVPGSLRLVTAIGAGLQLYGLARIAFAHRSHAQEFPHTPSRITRGLLHIAWCVLLLKSLAQLLACAPMATVFVTQRWLIIAFLHSVFLFVVLPTVVATAMHWKWMRPDPWRRWGLRVFLCAALVTEVALLLPTLRAWLPIPPWTHHPHLLLTAAVVQALAVSFLLLPQSRSRCESTKHTAP